MNKKILLFVICLNSFLYCQQLRKNTIYIEQDLRKENEMDEAISEQMHKQTFEAIRTYTKLLKKLKSTNSLGILIKYRTSNIKKLIQIEKITKLFRQQEFNFQKQKKYSSKQYIKEIFKKFPGVLISVKELKHLSKQYDEEKIGRLWQHNYQQITQGLYIGLENYIHFLLANVPYSQISSQIMLPSTKKQQTIKEAWAQKDPAILEQLIAQYPLIQHEQGVLETLGDIYFTNGEMSNAIGKWRRTLRLRCYHKNSYSRIIAKLALASFLINDKLIYQQLTKKFRNSKKEVVIMGKRLPLNKFLHSIPKNFSPSSPLSTNWGMYRGNIAHNRLAPEFSFQVPLKKVNYRNFIGDIGSYDVIMPVYWNGQLYYQTKRKLICLDLLTLKKKWEPKPINVSLYKQKRNKTRFAPIIANGCIYVFGNKNQYGLTNYIYALDANTGKFLWSWPPPQKDIRIYFNVAPVAVGNKLIVCATVEEGETSTEVLCFDITNNNKHIQNPKLLWRRFICSALERKVDGTRQKTTYASGLVSSYGMVYCCTNLGVVAALNAETGSIHWLNKYTDHIANKYQLRSNARPRPRSLRWPNLPPIAKNGKLYVTPTDSDKLYIYDCFSGVLQRIFPDNTRNNIFDNLIGVGENGEIFLAGRKRGKTQITALQEGKNREIKWQVLVPGLIRGNGLLTKQWIYIPVDFTLYRINTQNGQYKAMMSPSYAKTLVNPILKPTIPEGVQSVLSIKKEGQNYLILSGTEIAVYQSR